MASNHPSDQEPAEAAAPYRDAEAWLAQRGVRRDPIRVAPQAPAGQAAPAPAPVEPGPTEPAHAESGTPDGDEDGGEADQSTPAPTGAPSRLEDDIAGAVAFIRRSTSAAPQAEGRLREKLAERGLPAAAVEQALDRARAERLIDDVAMAAALVEERRRKGHAPARIRRDLRARGFDDTTLDAALADAEGEDPEAAAFAVAAAKAEGLTSVKAETAFRRVAAHVARRGYPDGLARKVAREAVFADREQQRTAEH